MAQVQINGTDFDLDVVSSLMDDEIREELHDAQDWKSEQAFVDAYAAAHAAKFGEDFTVN